LREIPFGKLRAGLTRLKYAAFRVDAVIMGGNSN
jgi:hypothetical protein